jgi:pyridoxamine 5'-phosphate oxidase
LTRGNGKVRSTAYFAAEIQLMSSISDIRKDYLLKELSETEAHSNAIRQFDKWWREALQSDITEVNAMTLATASSDGVPSARIVLLKGYDDNGFVFFTNYNSYKAKQLEENPRACLVFFWKEIERQVRITGIVEKVDQALSEAYFNSRPELSRVSAIASPQSEVVNSREWLEDEVKRVGDSNVMKCPPHWGGYVVTPITIEFWQGRPSRLHDRLQYTLEDTGAWKIERLAP